MIKRDNSEQQQQLWVDGLKTGKMSAVNDLLAEKGYLPSKHAKSRAHPFVTSQNIKDLLVRDLKALKESKVRSARLPELVQKAFVLLGPETVTAAAEAV